MKKQEGFTGRIGYVLAAAGSAVGLGNIWRFPFLAARYGGGIFLLTYLVLALTFGYTLLIAENCLGRMTGRGPIGAFRKLCVGKRKSLKILRIGGYINALVPLIIVPYYCVIGGWITRYIVTMLTNDAATFTIDHPEVSGDYFVNFITSTWSPIIYFLIFVALLVAVIAFGVQKGVERFNKILMPLLIVLLVGLCVYCAFLPQAGKGFGYYLIPNFSKFSYKTVIAAMGQLFFSLSIAMGIMITYGSYMRKEDDLVANVNHVEIFDTAVAFIAGLMIIPAVVAIGGESAAEKAGAGQVFITLPQVFASFAGGRWVGVAFFVFVLFAAATSALSLLETNVQTLSQEFRISRAKAIVIGVAEIVVIGVITILGYSIWGDFRPLAFIGRTSSDDNILGSLDYVSNYVLMPIGAIFVCLLILLAVGLNRFTGELKSGRKRPWRREYVFRFCMVVLVIPTLLAVLLKASEVLE